MKRWFSMMPCVACVAVFVSSARPAAFGDETSPQVKRTQPEKRVWDPIAQLPSELISEVSGVVASRKYPGVLWAHADSGNQPKIVAIDHDGNRLCEIIVSGAPNIDWEDIATDDDGHLFIGDIGNNTGLLPVRYIYQLDEPDPANPPTHPISPTKHWRVRYGEQRRSNLESLFWRAGAFYVVSRTPSRQCAVFRLVAQGDEDLEMQPVATLGMMAAAAADVSLDGSTLLLCSPFQARLFAIGEGEEAIEAESQRFITYPQKGAIEACCFIDTDIIFISESGNVFRTPIADFDNNVRFRYN